MAIVFIGANSEIAQHIIQRYAQNNKHLILSSRDMGKLNQTAEALRAGYSASISTLYFDVTDFASHDTFFEKCLSFDSNIEGLFVVSGYLGERQSYTDSSEILKILNCNATGAILICQRFAEFFKKKNSGFIVGISSVAGDRCRKENYLYGAAKAAFSGYLQGLRCELAQTEIHVLTVKPGPVDTPMIQHLPRAKRLAANPDIVAQKILQALEQKKEILYVPWFWRYILLTMRIIPEKIYKFLNL